MANNIYLNKQKSYLHSDYIDMQNTKDPAKYIMSNKFVYEIALFLFNKTIFEDAVIIRIDDKDVDSKEVRAEIIKFVSA